MIIIEGFVFDGSDTPHIFAITHRDEKIHI